MRGKGEGSVYRRADGYWVGQVETGRGPDGKRRRARVVRKRKADVLAALDELRQHAKTGVIPDRSTTVAAFLEFWLTDVVADRVTTGDITESTRLEYVKRVNRMLPTIGHHRLARLSVPHVQHLRTELAGKYSTKTVRTTLETLRAALKWGQSAELVTRNVAEHVTAGRAHDVKVDDTLTSEEAAAVLVAAQGDRLEALYWLALKYGLRLGELLDLRWADIDLDARELHVRQSKTKAGVRSLPLIDEAVEQLAHVCQSDGYVFPGPGGRRHSPQKVRRAWSQVLDAAGIEHRCRNCGTDRDCSSSVRRFHASRHTAATLLLEAGVALEVVSAILGHANIGVTADIYAKVRSDLKRRGLESLGKSE